MTAKPPKPGYNPNHIPAGERAINIVLSLIMFAYGTYGVIVDDLFIPGKRRPGVHLHGAPAWVMYLAFLCAIANMLSVVVDHHDTRDNEINYKLFARATQIAGWMFFTMAVVFQLIMNK